MNENLTISTVQKYFEENSGSEEVQQFVASLTPNFDMALKNPEFSKEIQSRMDSYANKQVEAYKEKGFKTAVEKELQQRIDSEVSKRLEAKNHKEPWQIQLEEQNAKIARMEQESRAKELREMKANNRVLAMKKVSDFNLPDEIIDLVVHEEKEKTEANVDLLANAFQMFGQKIQENGLKSNNVKIPGKTNSQKGLEYPPENATEKEWEAYYQKKGKAKA